MDRGWSEELCSYIKKRLLGRGENLWTGGERSELGFQPVTCLSDQNTAHLASDLMQPRITAVPGKWAKQKEPTT